MQVTLLNYTPNPELTVAASARAAYSAHMPEELWQSMKPEQVAGMFHQLLQSGHLSPFEHASFTFSISGISRVTSHQLVRHRMASYTQQSQRYVKANNRAYVIPPRIASRNKLKSRFDEAMYSAYQLYDELVQAGIPAEDARFVLPQAVQTQLVMTLNGRELIHASSLRLCLRAQWEIVELFESIKAEVQKVAPLLGAELQAKCYRLGYCDEKESCGIFPTRESPSKSAIDAEDQENGS